MCVQEGKQTTDCACVNVCMYLFRVGRGAMYANAKNFQAALEDFNASLKVDDSQMLVRTSIPLSPLLVVCVYLWVYVCGRLTS